MQETISARADFWLSVFSQTPEEPINYLRLMEAGVSRARSCEILKELKDAGFIKVVKYVSGGSKLQLVHSGASNTVGSRASNTVGSGIAVSAVSLVSSISNSSTADTGSYATNKFLVGDEGESETVGYEFFEKTSSGDDDLVRERQKHMAQKKADYTAMREKKAEARKELHRSKLDPASWTCKDTAYEFADRMANIWSIKPFSVTQSRFVQALAVFRKQHDTDGALELELINLFFSSLNHEKYTDGNHLWRAFLYKAPLLLQTAKERVVSVEQRETDIVRDEEVALRKLSIFDEDDDV